jgi:hypothetical protein
MIHRLIVAVALLLLLSGAVAAADNPWGDLTMRFVFDGVPPEPRLLPVKPGLPAVVDETLVVHADDRGIQNVVVWLERSKDAELAIHPDFAKAALVPVPVFMVGGRFEPHVAIVRTGQKLAISNFDPHGHNAKADLFENPPFNVLVKVGDTVTRTFEKPERFAARLSDSIHPWMSGFVLVRDDPYAAASDAHGKLKIARLPAGKWTFVVWHEKSGFVRQAVQGDTKHDWPRGRMTLEIKPGENDLGEFKLVP